MEEVVGGWRKFCIEGRHDVFLTWCLYDNKIKEDEIGRACGMYREEKKCLQNLGERFLREDTE
jgi:hypothetical protein